MKLLSRLVMTFFALGPSVAMVIGFGHVSVLAFQHPRQMAYWLVYGPACTLLGIVFLPLGVMQMRKWIREESPTDTGTPAQVDLMKGSPGFTWTVTADKPGERRVEVRGLGAAESLDLTRSLRGDGWTVSSSLVGPSRPSRRRR